MSNQERMNLVPKENNSIDVVSGLEHTPYKIVSKGAVKFIADSSGNIISNGYHEFQVTKTQTSTGEVTIILGKLGAMSRLLKMPSKEGEFFKESVSSFHDIEFNEGLKMLVAQTGALKYIINPVTGAEMSNGYHEIYKKGHKIYGKLGATVEEIHLSQQRQVTGPNHQISQEK